MEQEKKYFEYGAQSKNTTPKCETHSGVCMCVWRAGVGMGVMFYLNEFLIC